MPKIECFSKIKHREVQLLQDEFDRLVPEGTDMSEHEQKEIGKKIVLDYYKKLNQEINDLKIKLNKEPSEFPDKSDAGAAMANIYDNLISEIKNEANEQRKFKNQTSADQVQIIKTIEDEGQAAEIADNAETAEAVIRKIDDVLKSTPEQQARKKGEKEVDGTVIKRQEPVNAVLGNDVDVLFSKDKKQPAKYAVVELSDLQASHNNGIKNEKHFIPEAQPRDRGALEVLKNEAKDKAENLDPSQLADNNIAYFGSPIVNTRGEVIQGNGRAEAIDYYYNNNPQDSKGYKSMIESKAESLGLNADEVSKMKQPVLVRMADVNDEQAIILGNYTSSDLEDIKQKDADVKAAIGKLSVEDLKRLSGIVSSKISESDTLKSAIRENAKSIINLLMDIGALRADNREQYFNQDGVTPEGIEAAYNIVRQLLFEGGPADLSGKFDNLPFAQREAIEKTIPAIISNPELKSHIQSAIEILHDKTESGTENFNTWAKQYDLFKGNSPVETYGKPDLALAKRIDESANQKEISTTIKEVAAAMNGKPADMFESAKEGLPFEEAIAKKNITFQFQEPSSEEVEDMKEVIKEMVDADVLSLKEIQDKVAAELEDDSDELRDLVTTAYHEYGKDKENTPKQITGGVIGRIGKWLAKIFGGTQADKIFIAKDTESLERKAAELQGDIKYQKSLKDYVNIVLTSIALSSSIQTDNQKSSALIERVEIKKGRDTVKRLIEASYAQNGEVVPKEVIDRALKLWERFGKPDILTTKYDLANRKRPYATANIFRSNIILGNISSFDDFVTELAHAAQYSSKAELDSKDYDTQAEYDSIEYNRKGSLEYDAHKFIERMIGIYITEGAPVLEEFFRDSEMQEAKDIIKKYGLNDVFYQYSPEGKVLGFTHNGKIYLNAEHLNPNTPIHESGHIWTEWTKQNDTKVYNRGLELVTGSRYYDTVKQNKFYKEEANKLPADQREEYFKQEALAAAIGDRGAQFVTEAKKKGFAEWLNNLWEAIKNTLGLKNITAKELSELTLDEFAKRAAADILRQETEAKEAYNEISDLLKNWGLSFKDKEIIQGVVDTDEKILKGELSREQYLRMKINLLESQQSMQTIVRKARDLFGGSYIQMLMDIADKEDGISLPTKRNLATRLKEEVADGNKFIFDKVSMWAKEFATQASAAMNLGKPIDSVKELDAVSEPANEIMNEIGAEIKEGENIVLDAVSETTSDEILAYKQREEDLLNEIADLKQQLEDLENKKAEEKPNKKSKLSSSDYAERAKAADNRLGTDKKSIIDKIKEIIKKC